MSKASRRERQRLNRQARVEYEQTLIRRQRRYRLARFLVPIALIIVAVVAVTSLSGDDDTKNTASQPEFATISTSMGDIVIALDDSEAPKSEKRFVELAKDGFYDGTTIHRAVKDFVIQGGAPNPDGSGGSGATVPDELPTTPYELGDFVFANSGPNTSDSQFFIVTDESATEKLALSYNRFGRVIRGLDIAQQIEALAPPDGDGPPTQPVSVIKIVISKKAPPSAPNISETTSTT